MKIIKPFTLGVLHRPYLFLGQSQFAIAALGFFRLGENAERLLPDAEQWPLVMPLLPAGLALDEVMPKQGGEALLVGHAYAPTATPVCCTDVRMVVGSIDKRVRVVGPRQWRQTWLRRRVGPPQPFRSMPLTWEHAFGGKGYRDNPCGLGYRRLFGVLAGAMPNLEYAHRGGAACFAPLAPERLARRGKMGSYGQRWLDHEAPGLASDIDWRAFNCAAPDQWSETSFRGGEAYRLEGVHPDCPVLEGTLPDFTARAFILAAQTDPSQAREVPLTLDTVWFLPDLKLGVVVYHGQIDTADSDGLDVSAIMVAYEQRSQAKSASHYLQVLAWRSDATQAAQHLFDEAQLAPALGAATRAAHAQEDEALRSRQAAAKQAVLDELDAEFWAARGGAAPAGHAPPRARASLLEGPTPRELAARDFSMAAMLGQAQLLAAKTRRQAAWMSEESRADLPALLAANAATQFSSALERAVVPAYDLLPYGETGRDPELAEQFVRLERLHAGAQFGGAAQLQQARAAIEAAPAARRAARRAAPAPKEKVARLCDEAALRLGEQARQWRRCGISLAGRDLAGIDLRGADLAGADLRETMLEGADLSGARLAGANLEGAVLAGARLQHADLRGARLDRANLTGSDASHANLTGATLRRAQASAATWSGADLSQAVLDELLAPGINLSGARLDDSHMHGATLLHACADDSSWRRADLDQLVALRASFRRADFSGARAARCSLNEADLTASRWDRASWNAVQGAGATSFASASLRGLRAERCGMQGASFAGADLRNGRFMRCDFSTADLRGALLNRAHFPHCGFMAATLSGISARETDLYAALCRKARLDGADLTGARLVRAELPALEHQA